jgi:heterotetrameric sarcosine oxidase delta subunit
MLQIRCPWCGPREEIEFRYGGQSVTTPKGEVDSAAWSRYLFVRDNPAGAFTEQWVHLNGCRRWFQLTRDTLTHEITATFPPRSRAEDAR